MLGLHTVTHNDSCYSGSKHQVGRSGSVPQGHPPARLFKVSHFTHTGQILMEEQILEKLSDYMDTEKC